MTGRLYGVGVGPGDPKLLTILAVETIREADYVAYPVSTVGGSSVAYDIVGEYLKDKETIPYLMPMSRDKEYVQRCHDNCAEDLERYLAQGKSIAFITLGDPSVYSTYIYIHKKIKAKGYETKLIPGIPSFCAVAASLDDSLCEGAQPLIIVPASYDALDQTIDYEGNKVYMKSGKSIVALRERLREKGRLDDARMVIKASMPDEQIVTSLDEIDESASYFSIVLVKEEAGGYHD